MLNVTFYQHWWNHETWPKPSLYESNWKEISVNVQKRFNAVSIIQVLQTAENILCRGCGVILVVYSLVMTKSYTDLMCIKVDVVWLASIIISMHIWAWGPCIKIKVFHVAHAGRSLNHLTKLCSIQWLIQGRLYLFALCHTNHFLNNVKFWLHGDNVQTRYSHWSTWLAASFHDDVTFLIITINDKARWKNTSRKSFLYYSLDFQHVFVILKWKS